ncbi:transcriptional regulator FilR1 domain-containing protein [Halostella sp. PRR32]|uniref:helix-turn-helix transcriptional regulator n=1 Tax=Halostella sp. PRR32 TaxID=3098147 RepID=UPI002B1D85A5|nr:transcriptional regulator FilR1 domain-containing protein [Halostella sp. PRR32]
MHGTLDTLEFVVGSSARREVLSRLASGPATRQTVLDDTPSSKSSVYDSLNKLDEHGLVYQQEDNRWATTAAGQVLSDAIARCERTGSVLSEDGEYWERHDASGVPDKFRAEFFTLDDHEIIRSPDSDPYRASRRVADEIAAAECISVVTPVYHDRYAEALNESPDSDRRLVVTPEMIQRIVVGSSEEVEGAKHVESRVYDASFAMAVSDETLLLSLPKLDGSYDPQTEVVVETDAAVDWGTRLFEHLWERAEDTEQFVADRYDESERDA